MRFIETVRVESKPEIKRTEVGDKLVKLRARVSFRTRRQFTDHIPGKGPTKTTYSSTFVDFLFWKRPDGSTSKGAALIKPGVIVNIQGQYYRNRSKDGKDFDNFDVDEFSFPIGIDDRGQRQGSTQSTTAEAKPQAVAAAAPASTGGGDEEMPF